MEEARFANEVLLRRGRSFDILEATDIAGRRLIIKRAHHLDELGKLRFRREARLGCLLNHDGLASVLDHADEWIAFERLDGPLSHGRPRSDGLAALKGIADTLAHLHARGVVHRDLKPEHIMFRAGAPVLIDLGVAGLAGNEDPLECREVVGSPAWMAPEQLFGASPASTADIWSFSAVAHWVVTSRPLYAGTAEVVLEARRSGLEWTVDFSSVGSAAIVDLLQAGLAPPADRPTAREIAAALAEFIRGDTAVKP